MIEADHASISIRRQCELVGLARSTYYWEPASETLENLKLMRLIDEQHLKRPHMGRLSMTQWLNQKGYHVNIKRVRRLMNLMGLTAIYPQPKTTLRNQEHTVYPYLLRGLEIERPNQVWATDITYLPMERGFMYLVAIVDWYSRYVISWRLSNSLESSFCVEALEEALSTTPLRPEIFNSDQGSQFTSNSYTAILKSHGVAISMDGKGRAIDNVIVERFWRSLKYEEIYLKEYETVADLRSSLASYLDFYHTERPHQSLNGRTPHSVYQQAA